LRIGDAIRRARADRFEHRDDVATLFAGLIEPP
jgi:hypothetical protein